MNDQFRQDRDERDDELDRLLEVARWPDLPPAAVARLKERARRRDRWWLSPAIAAAAAIAVIAWLGTRQIVPQPSQPVARELSHDRQLPTAILPGARPISRAATPIEMIQVLPVRAATSVPPNVLTRQALADLAAGAPPERVAAALRPVADHEFVWNQLRAALQRDANSAPRCAAVAALLATPRQMNHLFEIYKNPRCRDAILPAIVATVEPARLERLLAQESDYQRRQTIIASLLVRGGGRTALALVNDSATRDEALGAMRRIDDPPVQPLLRALDDPSPATRMAAARALGSLCHANTLPTLERMVVTGERRREALTALLCCRDGRADGVIARLSRDPSIASLLDVIANEINQSL